MRRLAAGLIAVASVTLGAGSTPREQIDPAAARSMLERYERDGSASTAFADTKVLLASLDRAAPSWVADLPEPSRERRRQLVALMLLELSRGPVDGSVISVRKELIEWACAWLRRGAPTEFERVWMEASLAIYQPARTSGSSPLETEHTKHALSRFPKDPHLLLADLAARPEAFLVTSRPGADQARVARGVEDGRIAFASPRGPRQIAETRTALEEWSPHGEVGGEASARLGLLLFHLNDLPTSSATSAAAAERTSEPALQHFAWLNAGLALDAQGRRPDALEAYRRAARAIPDALSSSIALSAALFLEGERVEAAAVAERALSRSPAVVDPWQRRFVRSYRYEARTRELRRLAGFPERPEIATDAQRPVAAPTTVMAAAALDPSAPVSTATPQRPTFRGAATGVVLDVSVFDGRRPITGLTAADFEVLDDGVPQMATAATVESIPLDVTIVIDFTQEAYLFQDGRGTRHDARQAVRDLPQIAKLLRPIDRIRVIAAGRTIAEAVPLRAADPAHIENTMTAEVNVAGALYDGITAALVPLTAADRRHLVIIFTDGIDTSSAVTAARLREVALRSDPLIHLARRFTADELYRQTTGRSLPGVANSLLWPPATTVIEDIVRATGGDVRHAQPSESMVEDVRRVLERFRQSYLLHFQPAGVADSGWHTLSVRVKGREGFDVRARRGYFAGR